MTDRMMIQKGTFLKRKTAVAIAAVSLIIALILAFVGANLLTSETATKPEVFVGVDVAFGDEEIVYYVADKVAGYANLIILGSLEVTNDTAALIRVCDYLYEKGFYFIIYVGFAMEGYLPPRGPDQQFFSSTVNQWGDKFLGTYFFDEPGGKQIDGNHPIVSAAENFSETAKDYVYYLNNALVHYATFYYEAPQLRIFTSDYALYWYDYVSGYDVVFAEFVGDQSRQIAAALNRGAAHTFGKDWGIMITYPCNTGDCTPTPAQIYDDMVIAWNSGAKYIVVFDGNATTPQGVLTQEHFDAMKQFWDYTEANPRSQEHTVTTAYVLPKDYGYGMRGPNDKIWGLWEADELSAKIWNDINNLLATYGNNLDIIYETRIDDEPIKLPYNTLIFWNGTIVEK